MHPAAFNLSPRMICAYAGYRAPHPSRHAHRSRQYPAQACRGVYRRELGRIAPSSAATPIPVTPAYGPDSIERGRTRRARGGRPAG